MFFFFYYIFLELFFVLGYTDMCFLNFSKCFTFVFIFLLELGRFLLGQETGFVAQLARASGSYPEGRGFDPLRSHQFLDP